MAKKFGKEEKKEIKKEVKEVVKEVIKDGIIKTDVGFDVIHNGEIKAHYEGSDAFRVAVRDYTVLLGI